MTRQLLLGLVAASALTACSVYDSSLRHLAASNTGSGGGGTAGTGGTAEGGDGIGGTGATTNGGAGAEGGDSGVCVGIHPPDRPPANVSGPDGGGNISFTVVQYDVDLGDSDVLTPRYNRIGFDLDDECTTRTDLKNDVGNQGQECGLAPWTLALDPTTRGVPDGPSGQDNALGALIQYVRSVISDFTSANYTKRLQEHGAANAILQVSGYNGLQNDDQVTVSVLSSSPPPDFTPRWDGTDVWRVSSNSFKPNSSTPLFTDPSAFVVNGRLVAGLTQAGLQLVTSLSAQTEPAYLQMTLSNAFAVCDIVPPSEPKGQWILSNCTLAGRWLADDLVKQLAQFSDPTDTAHGVKHLCLPAPGSLQTVGTYYTFKSAICNHADMWFNKNSSPFTPCDALSVAVVFNTRPGFIGDTFNFVPPTEQCPPGQLPSQDSCETLAAPSKPVDGGLRDAGPGDANAGGASGGGGTSGAGGMSLDASIDR